MRCSLWGFDSGYNDEDDAALDCDTSGQIGIVDQMVDFASSDQFTDDDPYFSFYGADEDFRVMLEEALQKEEPEQEVEASPAQGMSALKAHGDKAMAPYRRHEKHHGRDRRGKHRSLRAHRTGFKRKGEFVSRAA